jgi:hypothetical protein
MKNALQILADRAAKSPLLQELYKKERLEILKDLFHIDRKPKTIWI